MKLFNNSSFRLWGLGFSFNFFFFLGCFYKSGHILKFLLVQKTLHLPTHHPCKYLGVKHFVRHTETNNFSAPTAQSPISKSPVPVVKIFLCPLLWVTHIFYFLPCIFTNFFYLLFKFCSLFKRSSKIISLNRNFKCLPLGSNRPLYFLQLARNWTCLIPHWEVPKRFICLIITVKSGIHTSVR